MGSWMAGPRFDNEILPEHVRSRLGFGRCSLFRRQWATLGCGADFMQARRDPPDSAGTSNTDRGQRWRLKNITSSKSEPLAVRHANPIGLALHKLVPSEIGTTTIRRQRSSTKHVGCLSVCLCVHIWTVILYTMPILWVVHRRPLAATWYCAYAQQSRKSAWIVGPIHHPKWNDSGTHSMLKPQM